MLSADITTATLDGSPNGPGLATSNFQSPTGAQIWAPTFYDPFQVKHRRRTSKKQFSILEKAFLENPKPNATTRRDLAEKLKMTVRGVQVWFQNRRAKAKAQKAKSAKKSNGNHNATNDSVNDPNANTNTSGNGENGHENNSGSEGGSGGSTTGSVTNSSLNSANSTAVNSPLSTPNGALVSDPSFQDLVNMNMTGLSGYNDRNTAAGHGHHVSASGAHHLHSHHELGGHASSAAAAAAMIDQDAVSAVAAAYTLAGQSEYAGHPGGMVGLPSQPDDQDTTTSRLIDLDEKLKYEKSGYDHSPSTGPNEATLLSNAYFQVEDDPTGATAGSGMVSFSDSSATAADYYFDKQESLSQSLGSSPYPSEFYGNPPSVMSRARCRAKSLPNVLQLGMYLPQSTQLANPLNHPYPFQGIHQHPQLSNQTPYSIMNKSATGNPSPGLSPHSLQFLRQKSFSPTTFNTIYSQKSTQLPPLSTPNDTSSASSPTLSIHSGSEKGVGNASQTRLPSTLVKHPDQIFAYSSSLDAAAAAAAANNMNRGSRGTFTNYMASPGLTAEGTGAGNGSAGNGNANGSNGNGPYSPSNFQNFLGDVNSFNSLRTYDESLGGFMSNTYSPFAAAAAQQNALNNPYTQTNLQNFVPELNSSPCVLPGVTSGYPNGFNPGRRSSCPPEFLASVNSLQLSMNPNEENGGLGGATKQKGLETIKEDEGIE